MIQSFSTILSHKRMRSVCTYISAVTLFFLSPLFFNSTAYAAVVINEVLPKMESPAQEWVELYNNGSESVSLNGWKLQNTTGDVKSFFLNASWIIAPNGFLTFPGSLTGISFSVSGDTIQLFDEKNNLIDSQSYPGTLGYNTSIGRSSDGGGVWTICTLYTYNLPNKCPQPSPTTTPVPTNTPIPTPKPTGTPIPTPSSAPTQQTSNPSVLSPLENQVPETTNTISPTPNPDSSYQISEINVFYATLILFVVLSWSIIAGIAYSRHKEKNTSEE